MERRGVCHLDDAVPVGRFRSGIFLTVEVLGRDVSKESADVEVDNNGV